MSYTQGVFLRSMCAIYLFAFLSFYIQIPGLYGNNGILPARSHLLDSGGKSLSDKIHNKPTLLWFASTLGLNTEYMMDVLCLLGIVLSFSGFVSLRFCGIPVFAALWSLYYSLYQVGQTFMWFQWDILLLEAGFICILVAPLTPVKGDKWAQTSPARLKVSLFLVKWLLFRLMFSSGVVKLQSGCPTWWGLTALQVHFESQPIPTPLAWYAHHLPTWFLKLGTVYTLVVEHIMPFLFFFPLRSVRITGFFFQILLQIAIILTGNYNFFNLLTICLCLCLLDDQFFLGNKESSFMSKMLSFFVNIAVHGFIIYLSTKYFSLRVTSSTIESNIAFTKTEFEEFLKASLHGSLSIGIICLVIASVSAIIECFKLKRSKISQLVITLLYILAAFGMFGISMVPFSTLHKSSNTTVDPSLRKMYAKIEHLQIANSYGLFRRMTGVGGRPEVVMEGSNNIDGPWVEYNFKYKPTDVNSSLSYIFPYQPRLDWQMWFASLGTYHQNPWLMSVAYRLLDGEKSVMQLIDTGKLPFSKPPKYLKASLYHYHYTPWSKRNSPTWWKREKSGEYFPIFTRDHPPLVDYLKSLKILDDPKSIKKDDESVVPALKIILDALRTHLGRLDPVLLVWSVFIAGFAIITSSWMSSSSSSSTASSERSRNATRRPAKTGGRKS